MGGSWAIRDGRFLSSSLYFLPPASAPSSSASFSPLSYFPSDRGRSEIVGVFPSELPPLQQQHDLTDSCEYVK